MRGWLLVALLGSVPAAAQTVECDTAVVDCDDDGFSIADGDCDDNDRAIHPGAIERCDDRLDNNCDGYFDEGCDVSARQGTLKGGGGCTGGDAVGGLLLLPLFVRRRSRRR